MEEMIRTTFPALGALQSPVADEIHVTGTTYYDIETTFTHVDGMIRVVFETSLKTQGRNASKIRRLLDRLEELDESDFQFEE